MLNPGSFILYVSDVARSADFYRQALAREPVEQSANFAMFMLNPGTMLGLWARHDVQPSVHANAGATELGLIAADRAEVDRLHAQWQAHGWPLLQAPQAMDFGYTACTADPDGHRLRAMHLT